MLYYLEQWHERGTSCIRINVEWRDRNSFSHQCGRYFRDSGGLLWRLDMSVSVKKSIWQTPAEGNWITSVVTTLTCGCGGTKRKKVKKKCCKKTQKSTQFKLSYLKTTGKLCFPSAAFVLRPLWKHWGQLDNGPPLHSCLPLWMCTEEDEWDSLFMKVRGNWFLGIAFVCCWM